MLLKIHWNMQHTVMTHHVNGICVSNLKKFCYIIEAAHKKINATVPFADNYCWFVVYIRKIVRCIDVWFYTVSILKSDFPSSSLSNNDTVMRVEQSPLHDVFVNLFIDIQRAIDCLLLGIFFNFHFKYCMKFSCLFVSVHLCYK